ncbi:MAG: hypothetical protein NTV36_01985 [Candidatus Staskawiczbacteria bacterium]|nr:hypothetical protein [Candidatus Staskawiczbacteria bacterium]
MAVVFISPKKRQKTLMLVIIGGFLVLLIIISSGVLLSPPKEVSPELIFNKPKVDINIKIIDSDQFKNLQAFTEMDVQYIYEARTADKKQKTGSVTAVSEDEARAMLESMGLTVTKLEKSKVGRDNPFIPYYQNK